MVLPVFSNSFGKILAFDPPSRCADKKTNSVFINFSHKDVAFVDLDSDAWMELDAVIASLWQRPQFLFGFNDRESMLRFSAAVVEEELSSLSMDGDVRYTVSRKECRQGDNIPWDYWYQATLESDELKGMPAIQPTL